MDQTPSKPSCCTPNAPARISLGIAPVAAVAAPFSPKGMVRLEGGPFLMGDEGPETWVADGEGPVRETVLAPFWIDEAAVSNAAFAAFVEATGYTTEAERFGWSFLHFSQLPKAKRKQARQVAGLEWWYAVEKVTWRNPLGGGKDFTKLHREEHPVVHVSWNDAASYAAWAGKRLPTEAEWEYASRGGLAGALYPWGNELHPEGKHRCNIWQGEFPTLDTGADGHAGTAPVRAFRPNGYGLFNTTGNVWEWVADWFDPTYPLRAPRENPKGPTHGERRVMRGGSYLCHASYCNRYRCAARTSNTPDSSTGHIGFRCVAD